MLTAKVVYPVTNLNNGLNPNDSATDALPRQYAVSAFAEWLQVTSMTIAQVCGKLDNNPLLCLLLLLGVLAYFFHSAMQTQLDDTLRQM